VTQGLFIQFPDPIRRHIIALPKTIPPGRAANSPHSSNLGPSHLAWRCQQCNLSGKRHNYLPLMAIKKTNATERDSKETWPEPKRAWLKGPLLAFKCSPPLGGRAEARLTSEATNRRPGP